MDSLTRLIGERVRIAREEAKLSQAKLTEALAFNDRQTLSTIENGQRRVSPQELLRFAEVLERPLEYFTDPYLVAGQNSFSYRSKAATEEEIIDFEKRASVLIASHRRFRELLDQAPSPAQQQITSIGERSPFEFATHIGERCSAAWRLGETTSRRLNEAATQELGITVLYVDAPESISGAACRLHDGAYVLINRNEPSARQNFDLGHEVFHLLTWDKLPPDRIDVVVEESVSPKNRPRVEKLADSFTAGLLMPSGTMKRRWEQRGEISHEDWILQTANDLGVSPIAVYWRMVNIGVFRKDAETQRVASSLKGTEAEARPQLFSAEFVRDLHQVLERGAITVRKAMSLLDMDQDEIEELFASYKMDAPFSL